MKLNKIALAVVATVATAASAGVTVSPVLLGYHHTDEAQNAQRKVLTTHKHLRDVAPSGIPSSPKSTAVDAGVALDSGLYAGAALGVELTPATQLQVEYGVTNTTAKQSEASRKLHPANRFEAEQETISGNLLIGTEQLTGYNPNSNFKPYVLVGGGQSTIRVKNKNDYSVDAPANEGMLPGQTWHYPAGSQVANTKNIVGNVGVGARYLVSDALALRGEARAVHNFDNKWWEALALAGLEVTLGGRLAPAVEVPAKVEPVSYVPPVVEPVVVKPVVIEQPVIKQEVIEVPVVDSDMDGVPDNLDACPGTPRNHVVDERGCSVQVDVLDALKLELRVFFDNDKSIIKPQYRQEVAKVAEKMREYPNATAAIEGHASKTGPSARYNQRLSEARANAVKSMLSKEFGIAPNRLSAVGYGYNRPIAPNNTEEGRAQNRRVYAVIQGDKTTTVTQTTDMQ